MSPPPSRKGYATYLSPGTTGVLYNNSTQNIDMHQLNELITKQIENAFTFSGDGFDVSMTANIRTVSNLDDIKSTDHVFQVVESSIIKDANKGAIADSDKTGLSVRLGTKLVRDIFASINTRTVAHEVGHTGGLEHTSTLTGLMTQSAYLQQKGISPSSAIKLTRNQINFINDLFQKGKLNNRSPLYSSFCGFGLVGFSQYAPFPMIEPLFKKKLR